MVDPSEELCEPMALAVAELFLEFHLEILCELSKEPQVPKAEP